MLSGILDVLPPFEKKRGVVQVEFVTQPKRRKGGPNVPPVEINDLNPWAFIEERCSSMISGVSSTSRSFRRGCSVGRRVGKGTSCANSWGGCMDGISCTVCDLLMLSIEKLGFSMSCKSRGLGIVIDASQNRFLRSSSPGGSLSTCHVEE